MHRERVRPGARSFFGRNVQARGEPGVEEVSDVSAEERSRREPRGTPRAASRRAPRVARADRDGAGLRVLLSDDEHVRVTRQRARCGSWRRACRALKSALDAEALRLAATSSTLAAVGLALLAHREDDRLLGREPHREVPAAVLDVDAEEALERARRSRGGA